MEPSLSVLFLLAGSVTTELTTRSNDTSDDFREHPGLFKELCRIFIFLIFFFFYIIWSLILAHYESVLQIYYFSPIASVDLESYHQASNIYIYLLIHDWWWWWRLHRGLARL